MFDPTRTTEKSADSVHTAAWISGIAALAFASGAAAQEAPPATGASPQEDVDEVVVTGFRASLNAALDQKQAQVGAIDMIVAEDIADFPDLNLAESLQRIPGVVISRDAGEGRNITIRGLGPQFARVRINGIEAMSANGGTDAAGGTNRGRNFDFNTFASDLFNSITVRKTATAETEEGSLGATVDLRAARPFDYDGFKLVGSLQGGYNDLNGDVDPRATLLISDTFAEDKFGALLSVAYSNRKLSDEGASTVRWQTSGNAAGSFGALDPTYTGTATLPQINAAFRPRIPRYDQYEHEQERIGITASLQFRPGDRTLLSLDALFAKYEASRQEIFLEAHVFSTTGATGINDVNPVAAEIDASNSLVYGVFNDVDVRSEARFDELSTEFTQVTLDLSHEFSDRLKLTGLVGFAEANHENPVQTTVLFDANNIDGYSYDYRENSRLPLITYGNAVVTNPSTWTLSQIRLRPQSTLNSFQTAALQLEFEVTDHIKLKFGPQWKNYIFESTELRRTNGTTANQETVIPANAMAAQIAAYSEITSFGDGLDLPNGAVTSWLIPSLAGATTVLGLNDAAIYRMGIEPALGNNYAVEEDDKGFFVQGDFAFDFGLRGNLGVRYVETEQTSDGLTFQTGTGVIPNTVSRKYSDTLPSLNLVYDIGDKFLMRLGAAKVMTRPNLGQLNPGAAVTVSGNSRSVNAGNPFLAPYRAKAYDLSAEWYFRPESLLSLALFYKDIGTFVQTVRDSRPFTGNPLNIPDSVAIAACGTTLGCSPQANWDVNLPANTDGGVLKGFEISYQQPFSFLPGMLKNFGTILNYTRVESDIEYRQSATSLLTVTAPLTQLSKHSYNATLYFDNGRFSARTSAAYRSDYLTTVPGRDLNNVEGTAETLNIDFSASFEFNDHFSISLEGLNLTDEVQDQWVDDNADRLSFYHHQGRQFYVGGRLKF
jgi:iron complex outermembrane receptor protein